MTVKKTREEIMADFENEQLRIEAMELHIDGHDDKPLVYHREMEDMPQRLHFILPENCVYSVTIKYKVKKQPLRNLTYKQMVKKAGIVVNLRKLHMGDEAHVNIDQDDHTHEVTFPPDNVPGGTFFRGKHPAVSTVYADGKEVWKTKWYIEIVKEGSLPEIGGY